MNRDTRQGLELRALQYVVEACPVARLPFDTVEVKDKQQLLQ